VIIAAVIVFVVAFGLGLGLVLGGGDDDSPDQEAAVATTDVPETTDAPDTTTPDDTEPGDEVDPDDPFAAGSLDDFLDDLPEGWEDMLPDDLLDDLSDLDGLDVPQMGDVQVTIVFTPDAAQQRIDDIRQAFEDAPELGFVQYLSAEDLDDFMGGDAPGPGFDTLTAFGAGDDAEATRDFVCSFADDESVQLIQVFGAEPCPEST
jgi:hypothetical protein